MFATIVHIAAFCVWTVMSVVLLVAPKPPQFQYVYIYHDAMVVLIWLGWLWALRWMLCGLGGGSGYRGRPVAIVRREPSQVWKQQQQQLEADANAGEMCDNAEDDYDYLPY